MSQNTLIPEFPSPGAPGAGSAAPSSAQPSASPSQPQPKVAPQPPAEPTGRQTPGKGYSLDMQGTDLSDSPDWMQKGWRDFALPVLSGMTYRPPRAMGGAMLGPYHGPASTLFNYQSPGIYGPYMRPPGWGGMATASTLSDAFSRFAASGYNFFGDEQGQQAPPQPAGSNGLGT